MWTKSTQIIFIQIAKSLSVYKVSTKELGKYFKRKIVVEEKICCVELTFKVSKRPFTGTNFLLPAGTETIFGFIQK